jgi:hypothetical protein
VIDQDFGALGDVDAVAAHRPVADSDARHYARLRE